MARPTRKPRVHLIVEGITEDIYFKHVNKLKYFDNVTVHPQNAEGISNLVKQYRIDAKVNEEIDHRFVVVDCDGNSQQFVDVMNEFSNFDKSLVIGNKVFFVNKEFELFLINHFHNKKLKHNKKVYYKEMEKIIGLKYEYTKSKEDAEKLSKKINVGKIDSALKVHKNLSNNKKNSPSSNIDELFNKVKKI